MLRVILKDSKSIVWSICQRRTCNNINNACHFGTFRKGPVKFNQLLGLGKKTCKVRHLEDAWLVATRFARGSTRTLYPDQRAFFNCTLTVPVHCTHRPGWKNGRRFFNHQSNSNKLFVRKSIISTTTMVRFRDQCNGWSQCCCLANRTSHNSED